MNAAWIWTQTILHKNIVQQSVSFGSVHVLSHPGNPGSLERKQMDFFKFLENILPFIWKASKKET